MLKNPQDLINLNLLNGFSIESGKLPDAIYIPFRNRYENLNELIGSLSWFNNPIILLSSEDDNLSDITPENLKKLTPESFSSDKYLSEITTLKTFKNSNSYPSISGWDLPVKRNFALLHAIKSGYNKILFIDDDIRNISFEIVAHGTLALETNNIVGSLIEGFPDTSVIGHIEQKYGEVHYPFLSGSFLFIDPLKTRGYFPLIYNEDWIFMIPSILNRRISAVGKVEQKEYDSFDSHKRMKLQEFGEIIAEGLFELVHRKNYSERYNRVFWSEYIDYRRSYVDELLSTCETKYTSFLSNSLELIRSITPEQCMRFIQDWEEDIETFENIKKNASEKSII